MSAMARGLGLALIPRIPLFAPIALIALSTLSLAAEAHAVEWRTLLPGLEYTELSLVSRDTGSQGSVHVVRIDPAQVELRALMRSELGGQPRTASRWCDEFALSAAINLGMYQEDGISNVGYARNGEHLNSRRWASTFQSAIGLGTTQAGDPAALVVDLDREGARESLGGYHAVIQNLRLIKSPGVNVWSKQERRWSEAALAMDRSGRILFLLAREAFAMWDFNRTLLALPLEIQRAMHMEGGRQASLSIRAPGLSLDLSGRLDTGFGDAEGSQPQRRIPNVIGAAPRPAGNQAP